MSLGVVSQLLTLALAELQHLNMLLVDLLCSNHIQLNMKINVSFYCIFVGCFVIYCRNVSQLFVVKLTVLRIKIVSDMFLSPSQTMVLQILSPDLLLLLYSPLSASVVE